MNDSKPDIEKPINVMIIGNNVDQGSLTSRLVQQANLGATVIIPADSIERAFESTRHTAVDCIILDVDVDSGVEVDPLESLRTINHWQAKIDAPVIVVTGENSERMGVDAVRLGAQDFISKDRISSDNIGKMIGFAIERYKKLQTAKIESLTDLGTGLCNRRGFINNLQQLIYEKERNQSSLVVAVIDLDDFKVINDEFGHAAGDQVLKVAGECLSRKLRRTDCVARLGGDEFALYLSNIEKDEDVNRILGEKLDAIREPIELDHGGQPVKVTIGASIGWIWWEKGLTVDNTIRLADEAMYAVKGSGKNRVQAGNAGSAL